MKMKKYKDINIDLKDRSYNREVVKSQFNSRYEHDCMAIDFYLSRGFYSVSSVKPGISLGVKVELTGLTRNNKLETSQKCNGS